MARGASAQVPIVLPEEPAASVSLSLRVQALYEQGKHLESLALLKEHLGRTRSDYPVWVLAARAALMLGYGNADPDSTKAWLHQAIEYGEEAKALDPDGEDGRYVTLAARGRLALAEGLPDRARLARTIEGEARDLLAIDSLHAGAHNALGRIYFEVSRLSRVERFFGRAWLGGDLLGRASWESAEYHLRRAVELQPERNFHHLDLGALLVARKRYDEARVELTKALEVPLETPEQMGFRKDARRLLDEIDRHGGGGTS